MYFQPSKLKLFCVITPQFPNIVHSNPLNVNSNNLTFPHLDFPIFVNFQPFKFNFKHLASPQLDFPLNFLNPNLNFFASPYFSDIIPPWWGYPPKVCGGHSHGPGGGPCLVWSRSSCSLGGKWRQTDRQTDRHTLLCHIYRLLLLLLFLL